MAELRANDPVSTESTLAEIFGQQAKVQPHAPFIVFPELTLTYGEAFARALAIARSLIARGIKPGDHVAVLMPNCIEAALIFLGTHLAGAVSVPINARFKRRELAHVIAHSDSKILFTTHAVREHVDFVELIWDALPSLRKQESASRFALQEAPHLETIVVAHGHCPPKGIAFETFLSEGSSAPTIRAAASFPHVSADSCAYLLYTSGTTADPKGCEITHRAIILSWSAYADVIGFQPQDAIWTPCPFFHVGGIGPMASAMARGGQFLSMTHFDADVAVQFLLKHRPAHLFPAFPQLTFGTLRSKHYAAEQFDFVRTVLNVGPPETQAQIQGMLPANAILLNDYGMTEGSGIITATRVKDSPRERFNTNGYPMPGIEVRIVDPATHQSVSADSRGEIQFRGVNAFHGYYKDKAATAVTIDSEGWVSSGDCGILNANGALIFIGRIKDILKVGGENVAPAEIEAYLGTHPTVKMAQVVGRADAKYGEVPVAFVELLPDKRASDEELIAYCVGHLANFKIPREIRFVTEWPTSATKIQKFKLRELL
jgi:fatty-acyl-CoA synthase